METNKDFGGRASCSSEETSDCYQHPNSSSSNLGSVEENNENSDEPSAEKQAVICALLKALMLVEQMEGSLADFEDVLAFSKELYCKNDEHLMRLWPKTGMKLKKFSVTVDIKIRESYTFVWMIPISLSGM